ncbi:PspC domain-containing protein [Pinibacter soli]|uniref:PspC domain-containing protein n=1 Tax=Pinibacter soli TaxID=3044211 RepID=A0ABT6RCH4_9BACT|nr:PspC domain-containing protein [Pinibacter soli]MDI3320255.1 PspC domain-containing protein [Pinibacter soli]
MKKIININFQGRVIPIEESAYDILKQYIDSLRKYFANEDGRDEIINDIEGRVAELFSDRLKRGANCITDDDINSIMASIGRPEDFDAIDAEPATTTGNANTNQQQQNTYQQQPQAPTMPYSRGRFFRNADDKIIGGVCSGIANYLHLDPVIVRIIFALLFGVLFWVYILLWVIVPSQSVQSSITKRLFRNADDKVIGGVCGGLASYFHIDSWIPRLIFALPFIIGIISSSFHAFFWDWNWGWHFGPRIITNSLGSTLFITYIILWIAVPYATSASEKLEMRGEKVDLNTIRNTVNDDLASMKTRAEKFGSEVKEAAQNLGERAKEFGSTAGSRARDFGAEAAPTLKKRGSDLGSVIGTLFKVVFFFIAGVIALSLFGVLIGLFFGGISVYPMKHFIFEGFWENFLLWLVLAFFLALPLVAIITWLIRRIMGVRSRRHYLGFVFGTLWTIGLIAGIILIANLAHDFKSRSGVDETLDITQPTSGKMFIQANVKPGTYYDDNWFGADMNHAPFFGLSNDSIMFRTVRINVIKSKDSSYHIYKVRFSRSPNIDRAKQLASNIRFDVNQQDSIISLPKGFAVTRDDKFRNQQVLLIVEVPVGKRIEMDESIDDYEWFNIDIDKRSGRKGINVEFDDQDLSNSCKWKSNVEYIMTENCLERVSERSKKNNRKSGRFNMKIDKDKVEIDASDDDDNNDNNKNSHPDKKPSTDTGSYRYHNNKKKVDIKIDSTINIKTSTTQADPNSSLQNATTNSVAKCEEVSKQHSHSPFLVLEQLF